MLKGYLSNDIAVYTAGELFGQNQAFLEGRIKGLWCVTKYQIDIQYNQSINVLSLSRNTNMFSIGFISLLHIVLNRMINFPSWESAAQISAPKVLTLCDPGTYHYNLTTTAYCQDNEGNTQRSIQCIQCPKNMYSSEPNQDHCQACDYGTYAPVGSSACLSCYNTSLLGNSTICANYIGNKSASKRKTYLAIFIPIGLIIMTAIIVLSAWYLRKRWLRQRALGSDETWLLNFEDLVKPSATSCNNTNGGGVEDTVMKEQQRDVLVGANGRILLGGSSSYHEPIALKRRLSTPIAKEEEEWNIGTSSSAPDNVRHSAYTLHRKLSQATTSPPSSLSAPSAYPNSNRSDPRLSSEAAVAVPLTVAESFSSIGGSHYHHKRGESRGLEGYKLSHLEKPKLIHALGFQ